MSILVSGSLAYDYIMDFPDSFRNHILPDQLHILNVCFVVSEMKKNFGGTAGNIAYTLKLLGGDPILFAPLGNDARDYMEQLQKYDIDTTYVPVSKEKMTASAHITTDKDNNQITAFYSGAGDDAVNLSPHAVDAPFDFAIIGPTHKDAMIRHAKECYEKKIPFCFDPGQQTTAFTAQELMMLIGQSTFLIGNDYEMKLMRDKTGWDMQELLNHAEIVITTLGEKGSVITTKDKQFEITFCAPDSVEDPTGAGDAYRAGFFSAYVKGVDLQTCGQAASVAATYAVEHYGTQNHTFTLDEFRKRYEEVYGSKLSHLM